jgi:hypothetical protein
MLSLKDLQQNLAEQGKSIFKVPLILQYNKRDLANEGLPVMPVEEMEQQLNRQLKAPSLQASALKGDGVFDTLKKSISVMLTHLHKELKW